MSNQLLSNSTIQDVNLLTETKQKNPGNQVQVTFAKDSRKQQILELIILDLSSW